MNAEGRRERAGSAVNALINEFRQEFDLHLFGGSRPFEDNNSATPVTLAGCNRKYVAVSYIGSQFDFFGYMDNGVITVYRIYQPSWETNTLIASNTGHTVTYSPENMKLQNILEAEAMDEYNVRFSLDKFGSYGFLRNIWTHRFSIV